MALSYNYEYAYHTLGSAQKFLLQTQQPFFVSIWHHIFFFFTQSIREIYNYRDNSQNYNQKRTIHMMWNYSRMCQQMETCLSYSLTSYQVCLPDNLILIEHQ
jgi:hypothetical protein